MTVRSNAGKEMVRLALAEALDEEPDAITATNPRWLQLMREGVLVRLHIGRWRARTSLRWQDLGLRPGRGDERVLFELLALGHKYLLPRDDVRELDSIDSSARKWLEKNAFRTYWGFFVPVTAYRKWRARNAVFRREYMAARDRLTSGYGKTVERVLAKYRIAARSAYGRLRALHPGAVREVRQAEFTTRFVEEVSRQFPSRQAFHGSFYFDVELEYVPLPSLLARDQAEAEHILITARAEQERHEAQLRIERERAWAEEQKARAEALVAWSAAEWKERSLQEMHQEVMEQARGKKEQVVDIFLRDVVAQLRSLVYEVTTDVLSSIEKNRRLHPRSVVQLRNLVEQVGRLNFAGDQDLEAMIAEVQADMDLPAQDRSISQIETVLRDIAIVTRSTLIGLGEQPRSARSLGVADEPVPALVRAARRRLIGRERCRALPLPGMPDLVRRGSRMTGMPIRIPALTPAMVPTDAVSQVEAADPRLDRRPDCVAETLRRGVGQHTVQNYSGTISTALKLVRRGRCKFVLCGWVWVSRKLSPLVVLTHRGDDPWLTHPVGNNITALSSERDAAALWRWLWQ